LTTYLFTGATGQLGQAFIRAILKDEKNHIIGLHSTDTEVSVRLSRTYANLSLVKVEEMQESSFRALLDLYRPDIVGHLSAQTSVWESKEEGLKTFNKNVKETYEILRSLIRYKPVTFFNMSSSEIFGSCGEINESSKIAPSNPYGVSKACAHLYVDSFRHEYGVSASNIISGNFISEFQSSKFVIGKTLEYIKNGPDKNNKLKLGNLDSVRDWMYVDDLVHGILRALEFPANNWCVAANNVKSVGQVVKLIFDYSGFNYRDYVEIEESLFRKNDTVYGHIDSSRLRSLGWEPKYATLDIIRKLLNG